MKCGICKLFLSGYPHPKYGLKILPLNFCSGCEKFICTEHQQLGSCYCRPPFPVYCICEDDDFKLVKGKIVYIRN